MLFRWSRFAAVEQTSLTPSVQKPRVQGGHDENKVEFFPIRREASAAIWQNFGITSPWKRCDDTPPGVCHGAVLVFDSVDIAGIILADWTLVVLKQTISVPQTLFIHAYSRIPFE